MKTSVKSLENSDGSDSIISTSSPALTTTISTKLLETTIDKSSSIKFSTTIDNDTKDKNSQSLSTITTYITTRTTSSIITTSSESSPSSTFKPDHGDKPQIAQPKIPKIPCSYEFEENYCLNGGKCYNYTIEQFYIPSCECAEGFMGERCENKYLIGSYSSKCESKLILRLSFTKHISFSCFELITYLSSINVDYFSFQILVASKSTKIHLETASICYGAFMALILVIFIIYFLYCYTKVFRKKNQKK